MTSPMSEPQYCDPDLSEMGEAEQRLFILTKLSNPWWRLNHLYKIQNEKGELVTFRMRPAQRQLFRNMHNKNVILKARQLGFSTAIDIYLLDQALFTPHLKCGIVAQDKQAASEIFRTKIAVPFDNLPAWLRASFSVAERRSGASGGYILFGHGSSIQVATSFRSGTVQRLHISEHGKICAKYPAKAKEVRTGTLNAVADECIVFIESTAEGVGGDFYSMSNRAQEITASGLELSLQDYKFHFYAWWQDPKYSAKVPGSGLRLTREKATYFAAVEQTMNMTLTDEQKCWYINKEVEQREEMKQEFPSTPQEAFLTSGRRVFDAQCTLSAEAGCIPPLIVYDMEPVAGESLEGYGKVHAFYRPDKREIVLVADNIPDGRTVREKLRHEIIHHAMEQVVTPAEYKTIVNNVLKTRDSDNATMKDVWRKVDADYGNESPEVQAGEFLAHMAEKHTPGRLAAAWNRVVVLIKAVLRRTGLLQPSDLNDVGYIRDTIRTLGQRVREGYVPREGGDVSYSRTGKPDPFRVPEGEGERYRRDLAKAVKSHRSSDISITIGRTPPVLRHIGAPDLPLVISRDTVRKATNGVKHDVPMDVIEQLPELMHDPEAVYQSATEKNAVVMLFDAVDKNGDPVIGAVHLKADKKGLEINKVASVYGAFPSKMSKMDREGLALYKKQNPDNQTAGVLQLHGDSDHQGSVSKILSPDDIRKGPYYSRSRSALSPEETLSARFVRSMQDKFQVLKAVQDNIRKSGGKLDDSNDAYLAEELFHGKAENDLHAMKERYVKPLAKLLAEYDIPQSALDEYLYARHAPERNLHIAKINPKMPDGGSGMTNAEAAGIMDQVSRSGKQAQYDRLAGIVDDMLARRRELITNSGLEDKGTVDVWQKAYKHYVPLKGQDADGVVMPRTGKGFVIGGRESKQAMGRNSRAQSSGGFGYQFDGQADTGRCKR